MVMNGERLRKMRKIKMKTKEVMINIVYLLLYYTLFDHFI